MFKLILKGFIIGVGKIIPGVSGSVLAISLGVYEKSLNAIGNFFKDPIKHFKFLFSLGIGVVLAISFTSKFILFLLNNYYVAMMSLFIGLISGGIVPILKKINTKQFKISNYLIIFLSFIFVFGLSFISSDLAIDNINNPIIKSLIYFLIGFIDAATMIIPGISGTAIMIILGIYDLLLDLLVSITDIFSIFNNLVIFIPYLFGIIATILFLSKLMSFLFTKKPNYIYSSIIGFSISSIILLIINLLTNYKFKIYSILFFLIGLFISSKLES